MKDIEAMMRLEVLKTEREAMITLNNSGITYKRYDERDFFKIADAMQSLLDEYRGKE